MMGFTLDIGVKAPGFSLRGVDDQLHSLSEYEGAKAVVVVVTCNHCPTAQAYEERIKKLAADYKDKGVAVVPGEGFGAPGYLRLSFASAMADLREGARRIADALVAPGRGRA